jgi:2-amino-4-hydroxy-6-hydroxymethyldihydropteridine diphosphokinase
LPRGAASHVVAYVGLGANVGDPLATLQAALAAIHAERGLSVVRCSSLYRTEPWGGIEQPPFLNAVAQVETALEPHGLLAALLAIEARLGRVRDVRWGPRTCDLDVLLIDGLTLSDPDLVVPHPRLVERRFALEPLLELDPDAMLPDGRLLADLCDALPPQGVERLEGIRLHWAG